MSVQNSPRSINLTAAADLSTKQFYLMRQTTDTAFNITSATTQKILGSLQNKPKSGETGEIAVEGNIKCIAGGTIAVNDVLTTDANGKVVAATQTTAGSQPVVNVIGYARQAGVSGDIIEVEVAKFLY